MINLNGVHVEVYLKRCLLQVIDDLGAIVMRDGEPLEASITEGMSHPNIVNTIAHTVTHNSTKRCASHRCCTLHPTTSDGRG